MWLNDIKQWTQLNTYEDIKKTGSMSVESLHRGMSTFWSRRRQLMIYHYLFHNKPYSTAKRKKQWNRTDKANSSYRRTKKQKNENESDCNKYQQIKLTIYTTDLHAYTQFHANKMYEHIERNMKTQENWWMSRHLRSFRLADEAISYQLL